ncbi:uncharacterized protein LOC125678673 [Ostrea edulis]|uniref:uncharacterized protein LOC125678673 n=1 Tax=Ostrea edulis TaxID=37623 RepID=UPI0024AEBBCA|nr:uncharacterized protein LOC125678673 [Ostrea edulis]
MRCIRWTKLTDFSYSYVVYNDLDTVNGYRVQLATTPLSSSIQTSCSPTTNPSAEEFHVLVKTVSSLSVYKECPSLLQGLWKYEHQSLNTTSCRADSSLSVCGTTVKFNYQKCNKTQAFSEGGEVNCIHTKMDNVSQHYFTIVYNADENIDTLTTHRFTCFAFVQNESVVQASDSAGSCEPSQTATNRQTDGSGTLLLQKSGVCRK